MTSTEHILRALDGVIDPELDEPITTLRFISSCDVTPDGDVEVVIRLPTPQCAPNFAFLMTADARDAVRRLPGIRHVSVRLMDHYTGEEINEAMARGDGFTGAFPGETADDDLSALRELFTRKALIARQSAVCERLLADGATGSDVVGLRVRDLPGDADARRCLELRDRLGIGSDPEAPAFVLPTGEPLVASQLDRWRRMARLVRTSLEANGGICRALLGARYDLNTEAEEVAR